MAAAFKMVFIYACCGSSFCLILLSNRIKWADIQRIRVEETDHLEEKQGDQEVTGKLILEKL